MSDDRILLHQEGAVGYITFNNPKRHNAVSLEMWEIVVEALKKYESDDSVRVVVVTGAGGKAFVSGADISKFETERATHEAQLNYNVHTREVYTRLHEFPKPTIAMIRGYCIGGGLALAVCCDLRIATEKSQFGLPAARLALGYPFEGLKRLSDLVGPANAKQICFTAKRFDTARAVQMGLLNEVVEDGELETFVSDYATNIANNAPLTVNTMKFILGQVLRNPEDRDLDRCQRLVNDCFASEDYVEGRVAFMEKREPVFKGA